MRKWVKREHGCRTDCAGAVPVKLFKEELNMPNTPVTAADFAALGIQPESQRFMTPEQLEMQRRSLIGNSPIPLQAMHETGQSSWMQRMADLISRGYGRQ